MALQASIWESSIPSQGTSSNGLFSSPYTKHWDQQRSNVGATIENHAQHIKCKAIIPVKVAETTDFWAFATTGLESDESQLSWVAIKVNTPSFFTEPKQTSRATITRIKAVGNPISAELVWLAEFYDKHSQASTAEEIFPLISGIGEMFQKKQYDSVDKALSEVEFATLSPTVMITLVRTTYPARKKLDRWSSAVEAVKDQLDSQGLDSKRLLRGLV